MANTLEMIVKIKVTVPQALALQAMFEYWNWLGAIGSSREVAFYADGDGDFHPECVFEFSAEIPKLTEEMKKAAVVKERDGNRVYDFDPIAWKLDK